MASRVLVVVLALAALLAGCGGNGEDDDANDYVSAVNTAQTRFSATVERVGGGAATNATVARFDVAIDRIVADLEAAHPPKRVERMHRRLIAEFKRFGAALTAARRGLASGDRTTILRARARLLASAERAMPAIDTTIAGINRTLRS